MDNFKKLIQEKNSAIKEYGDFIKTLKNKECDKDVSGLIGLLKDRLAQAFRLGANLPREKILSDSNRAFGADSIHNIFYLLAKCWIFLGIRQRQHLFVT